MTYELDASALEKNPEILQNARSLKSSSRTSDFGPGAERK